MKALKLTLTDSSGNQTSVLPPNLDLQFGPTGFVYLGLFCFVYKGNFNGQPLLYNGEMKWINSKNSIFFPEDSDLVYSFASYLKPGVYMKPTILDKTIDGTAGILSGISLISPARGSLF